MKHILFLFVFALLLLALLSPTSVKSQCTDNDGDGTCADVDCDDWNSSRNERDFDNDGITSCGFWDQGTQGVHVSDCEDNNPAINFCEVTFIVYPIFYNPPEQTCRSGITFTRKRWHCVINPVNQEMECTQVDEEETTFLENCD